MAQHLGLRCVLFPAPWALGVPTETRLESSMKKTGTPFSLQALANMCLVIVDTCVDTIVDIGLARTDAVAATWAAIIPQPSPSDTGTASASSSAARDHQTADPDQSVQNSAALLDARAFIKSVKQSRKSRTAMSWARQSLKNALVRYCVPTFLFIFVCVCGGGV